jgi:hypothetical protein
MSKQPGRKKQHRSSRAFQALEHAYKARAPLRRLVVGTGSKVRNLSERRISSHADDPFSDAGSFLLFSALKASDEEVVEIPVRCGHPHREQLSVSCEAFDQASALPLSDIAGLAASR